jgi:hypothetical protein
MLMLNKLNAADVNYKNNDYDEMRAKVFGWFYKIRSENYKGMSIVGTNRDVERIDDWKMYMILLSGNNNHKILKVCYPISGNFAIVLQNFETKCEGYVRKIGNMRQMKTQTKSFLEKSSTTVESKYSIESLADKFSVEELVKIKSLIKFAKRNKVIDKIYDKGGDVDIAELFEKPEPQKVNNTDEIDELKKIISTQNDKINKLIDIVGNNTIALKNHTTHENYNFKQIEPQINTQTIINPIQQTTNTIQNTQPQPQQQINNNSFIPELSIPKQEPKLEPKPVPKYEPKPEPKPEPITLKLEPKPEPKPEVKRIISPFLSGSFITPDDDDLFEMSLSKPKEQEKPSSIYDDFSNP